PFHDSGVDVSALGGDIARPLRAFVEWFGDLGIFAGQMFRSAIAPPYQGRELLRQLDQVGSKSLGLVALAGAAIGVVLSLQTRESLIRFGAKSMLPTLMILSV